MPNSRCKCSQYPSLNVLFGFDGRHSLHCTNSRAAKPNLGRASIPDDLLPESVIFGNWRLKIGWCGEGEETKEADYGRLQVVYSYSLFALASREFYALVELAIVATKPSKPAHSIQPKTEILVFFSLPQPKNPRELVRNGRGELWIRS